MGRIARTIYPGTGEPSKIYLYDPAGRLTTRIDRKRLEGDKRRPRPRSWPRLGDRSTAVDGRSPAFDVSSSVFDDSR